MFSDNSGGRYLTPIDDQRWAVQDETGATFYTGPLRACETWLDADEQRRQLKRHPARSWLRVLSDFGSRLVRGLGRIAQRATSGETRTSQVRRKETPQSLGRARSSH